MFRAYEPDRDRLVAVKLFRLDIPPDRVHRLAAELDTLVAADLRHPAIASPIAAGIAGVSAYLVQDFVAADSLDLVLRERGPSPLTETMALATQLAGGLDAAAAIGLIHGALHPRDVLVSSDVARLTGVGVARALERTGVPTHLRRPYTAPERTGSSEWDRRADVFSLAAITYEMIWGRRLAGTGERASQTLTKIEGGDLAALRRVFARALAVEPRQRFDTALAFVEALTQACSGDRAARPVLAAVVRDAIVSPPTEPEPLLPLDELILARPAPAEIASGDTDDADDDLTLDRPVEQPLALADDQPFEMGEVASGTSDDGAGLAYATDLAEERSSTSVRPLALALFLGVAMGFAGGYALGYRAQPGDVTAAMTALPAATLSAATRTPTEPPVAAREFTEGAVKDLALPAAATVTPAPREGHLQIRSTPAGARVFVDGREAGRTPITQSLVKGGHSVRIVHDGYAPVERRVTVTPAAPASVNVALTRARIPAPPPPAAIAASAKARGRGLLGVDSRPAGASVYVDGRLVGTTPLSLDNIAAGEHTVHLERDGYQRWNSSVRVVAGERNRVAASLER